MRDLGGQIYKVELIISIGEARVALLLPLPALLSTSPSFCLLWFHLLRLQVRRQLVLADVLTRSHIQFFQADVHSAPFHQRFVIQREQTLWEQIGAAQRIEHKKSCREPDRFYALTKKGVRWGGCQGEKSTEQNFMGGFFFIYSKIIMCWIQ